MFPFSALGPIDRSECKALIAAAVACLVFIIFLFAIRPRDYESRASIPPERVPLSSDSASAGDSLAMYRIKTEDFYETDFWNFSYGPYTLPDGKKINLNLENSRLELPNNWGSVSLKDVYYKDVTGDGRAEAIVWLKHVQCAGPCDGGSNLFYIYTVQGTKLKPIWQYETGSYAHTCSLKTLTISGRQLVLELFGHCTGSQQEDSGPSKLMVNALTFVLLQFDGQAFRQQSKEVIETSPTNVSEYEPAVRIFSRSTY
jgi:hypothetical protein